MHLKSTGNKWCVPSVYGGSRWLKVELRQLNSVCPGLDRGNVCPACPKASGAVIVSFDALFGLPRKKAAGSSHRDPLYGDLFFGCQSAVDNYVMAYEMSGQRMPNMCSHFLAGDSLRSSRRYHALDETAVHVDMTFLGCLLT